MRTGLARLAVMLCLLMPAVARGEPTLFLNTAMEPPLHTADEAGAFDRLMHRAFARIGLKVVVQHLPAERALLNASSGLDDGDGPRIEGLDALYPGLVRVPEKVIDFDMVAVTRIPNVAGDDWSRLEPYDVGLVRGWKIIEANTVNVRSRAMVRTPSALFRMLKLGRIEIAVLDRLTSTLLVETLGVDGARILEPPLSSREMFVYLNRKHEALVPRLAATLAAMKADGEYARLMRFDR